MIGALGDIHGAFEAARTVIARHPEVLGWLCVGDIADEQGRYEPLGARVYWIHGNNDNLDAIASGDLPADLEHIDSGTMVEIRHAGEPVVQVAGLGGTFAPTWYETPAAELPHPKKGSAKATQLADKRRHFVHEEIEASKCLREIDILLTHEAPKPFRPFANNRGPDAGKAQINEILAEMKPRLHLFGHHHRFSDQYYEGVRSIGLDLITRGYLLIDTPSLRVDTVKY